MKIIQKIPKELLLYLLGTVLSLLGLTLVLNLWNCDLRIPFSYDNDGIAILALVKGILDNGWYLENDWLGAPFGRQMHDYPMAESFNIALIKLIGQFVHNYAVAFNLFYLSTYVAVTITSIFVLRQLGISRLISLVFSLLYSFQPYHFLRGTDHLFLSAYYMVPFVILVALWIWLNKLKFLEFNFSGQNLFGVKPVFNKKSIISFIVCLLSGSTGVYYAFFGCFLFAVAAISNFLFSKSKQALVSSVVAIALTSMSVFLNIYPNIIYVQKFGPNSEVATRSFIEADIYGLKSINLILPLADHRIPSLRQARNEYDSALKNVSFPIDSEGSLSSLGIIASMGFLFLLVSSVAGLYNQNYQQRNNILMSLSGFNAATVLFANIGSFGLLFNLLISPQIRAYTRASIFIAFFSLSAMAIILDNFKKNYELNKNRSKYLFSLGLALILVFGIFDQTAQSFVPSYKDLKQSYLIDRMFVKQIEQKVPENSMIFQLPYMPFPEHPPINFLSNYALFKGYLHSEHLRWSFGVIRGRHGNWHEWVSNQPLEKLIAYITAAGFQGIYLDRRGYPDLSFEASLQALLNIQPILSQDKMLVFFDLNSIKARYQARFSNSERASIKKVILDARQSPSRNSVSVQWLDGFYSYEKSSERNWRWASKEASIKLSNSNNRTVKIMIKASLATGYPDKSRLRITSTLLNESLDISNTPSPIVRTISVPPGEHIIKFTSEAKEVNAPQDSRDLFFQVVNFESYGEDEIVVENLTTKLFGS